MKSVMRFGKKEIFSPRYVGPCRIFKRPKNVAYKPKISLNFITIYPVFTFIY